MAGQGASLGLCFFIWDMEVIIRPRSQGFCEELSCGQGGENKNFNYG